MRNFQNVVGALNRPPDAEAGRSYRQQPIKDVIPAESDKCHGFHVAEADEHGLSINDPPGLPHVTCRKIGQGEDPQEVSLERSVSTIRFAKA